MLLATLSVDNGAAIYGSDFFTVPTDFWLNMYWLLPCGPLTYLLGYGFRALLILRKDPRSRRIVMGIDQRALTGVRSVSREADH